MVLQYILAWLIDLALPGAFHSGALKAKIKTADAAK